MSLPPSPVGACTRRHSHSHSSSSSANHPSPRLEDDPDRSPPADWSQPDSSNSPKPMRSRLFISTLGLSTGFIFLLGGALQNAAEKHPIANSSKAAANLVAASLPSPSAQAKSETQARPSSSAGLPTFATARVPPATAVSRSVFDEARSFEDPAAEQLIVLMESAGWSKSEQASRFADAYEQLRQVHEYDDQIAMHRLKLRSEFLQVGADGRVSAVLKRNSRLHATLQQQRFEERLRAEQGRTLDTLVESLGKPRDVDAEDFKNRLREIHPILPLGDRLSPSSGSATAIGKTH